MQRRSFWKISFCLLVVLVVCLIALAKIKRSPWYVLEYESIPYQEEAIDFFDKNKSSLLLLSNDEAAFSDLPAGFNYYLFQFSDIDDLDIPNSSKKVLLAMEASTPKQYNVLLWPNRIEVRICFNTHLLVVLTDEDDMLYGIEDNVTDLGDGWSMHVAYVRRG